MRIIIHSALSYYHRYLQAGEKQTYRTDRLIFFLLRPDLCSYCVRDYTMHCLDAITNSLSGTFPSNIITPMRVCNHPNFAHLVQFRAACSSFSSAYGQLSDQCSSGTCLCSSSMCIRHNIRHLHRKPTSKENAISLCARHEDKYASIASTCKQREYYIVVWSRGM